MGKNKKEKTLALKTDPSGVGVDAMVSKPNWWVNPLTSKDAIYHGCLNCGGTKQTLGMETRLYNSFGGWCITKDGKLYFQEDSQIEKDWEENKTLAEIEEEAKKEPEHDWRANFDLPLRGGSYQRHYDEGWVLIESNQGFA